MVCLYDTTILLSHLVNALVLTLFKEDKAFLAISNIRNSNNHSRLCHISFLEDGNSYFMRYDLKKWNIFIEVGKGRYATSLKMV